MFSEFHLIFNVFNNQFISSINVDKEWKSPQYQASGNVVFHYNDFRFGIVNI